jgi:hypothetical protein
MLRVGAIIALAAAFAVPAGGATTSASFAFGRQGGNIIPFTVAIAVDGRVHITGYVHAGRTKLTTAQLAALALLARQVHFTTLPALTMCPNTLPDVATTFVRVGARTVRVHGGCVARVTRLWNALRVAVQTTY